MSRRSIRAHIEWNVETHAPVSPTRSRTRFFISSAALLVKVIARMECAGMPVLIICATRRVMTRVLPEPAAARIISGPST